MTRINITLFIALLLNSINLLAWQPSPATSMAAKGSSVASAKENSKSSAKGSPKRPAQLSFCGQADNDVFLLLKSQGLIQKRYPSPETAIQNAVPHSGVLIIAGSYPQKGIDLSPVVLQMASTKGLRLYIEYPSSLPGLDIGAAPYIAKLERGVVTGDTWQGRLAPMSLLSINGCHILPVVPIDSPVINDPLIVLARVAGFNKAEYGIADVKTWPVLFRKDSMLVAMTALSNFATGRYGPRASWQQVWEYILSWLTGQKNYHIGPLPSYVAPMYGPKTPLASDARRASVAKGVEWYSAARLLIHPLWQDSVTKYMGNGLSPYGPPVKQTFPAGDGSLGMLEGHISNIGYDGTQQYRYWVRADVQGEAAFAFAAAGSLLEKKEYYGTASNLADFMFAHSNLRAGPRNNKDSASFGLLGWATTHPGTYYGDDNARAILGIIGASSFMKTGKWNKELVENIMANFRTTGREGFRGNEIHEDELQKEGWRHFQERSLISPHPHYESWMWACYLWLYEQTRYAPLLEKTKNAIRLTMEAYPDKWLWTNGIQQERARMILPLAWLVRIEDTQEHRHWLDEVVTKLLESQQPSGAIREELGAAGKGSYGASTSNKEYGLSEAPLIFTNGDEVADMLYTSNFAFFSLNEAAKATGNPQYQQAVDKLSDFLIRIQVRSARHPDTDGAWFRAFDYGRWDYWASNADAGWGAWCTLTGWIQAWIVATQVLVQQKTSYWDATRTIGPGANKYMPEVLHEMFGDDFN